MKRDRCLPAACRPLNDHDLILCIPYDLILFFLNRAHDILQLDITAFSQLLFQNIIIDLHITLKFIDHPAAPDLVLPLRADLSLQNARRRFIGGRAFIIIIKQTADRSPPVIDQRNASAFFCKISDSYIECLRLIFSGIYKIHTSEKRRIKHFKQAALHSLIFLIRIDLRKKRLLIIKILISVLIHLGIVFPIILIHTFDVFPNRLDRLPYFPNLLPEFFCHLIQKLCASRHIVLPFLLLIFTGPFSRTYYLNTATKDRKGQNVTLLFSSTFAGSDQPNH